MKHSGPACPIALLCNAFPHKRPILRPLQGPDQRRCRGRQVHFSPFPRDNARHGIDKPNPDTDALIIWQHYKPMYPLPALAHWKLNHARMRDDLPVINADELTGGRVQVVIQVMMLCKGTPDFIAPLAANFVNIDADFRPLPFACTKKNRCWSVSYIQSGSSHSVTSW